MSLHTRQVLDTLVGQALCDREVRAALLNGQRADVIAPLGLAQEEANFVLGISAGTLHEFAQKLHRWLDDGRYEEQLRAVGRCGCWMLAVREAPTGGRNGLGNR